MSAISLFTQTRRAMKHLNPNEVREQASRPINIGLVAPDSDSLWRMERYFCPPELSPSKRAEVSRMLHRVRPGERTFVLDLEFWDSSLAHPEHVFSFDPNRPERTIEEVLDRRPELWLPLARHIFPFRKAVVDRVIGSVAKENALFSMATAVPDIVPLLSIPWALGQFASDTAFLTMNQIRMTFLIAAASDCQVGYKEQKGQIASVVASAFGFRAIARQLIAKIPLGGGLIPKAAIAWSGTQVVGRSMERYFSIGYPYTEAERRSSLEGFLDKGREVAASLMDTLRGTRTAA
jgi:hypothetical protein